MPVNLSPVAGAAVQFFTSSGVPLAGGKLYSYAAGTTTPQATYTSSGGGTASANPIVLDSAGRVSGSGEVWLTGNLEYKFILKDSTDVLIGTYDNIRGIGDTSVLLAFEALLAGSTGSSLVGFLQSGTSAVATTVQAKLRQTVSVLDFGAIGNGVFDNTTAMTAAHATGKVVYYPAGDYRFSGTISMASGGIVGDSVTKTYLVSTSTAAGNLFTYTGSDAGYFSNFQIQAPLAKVSGAAIEIITTVTDNAYSYFSNVNFYQLLEGIRFTTARLFKVVGCNFISYRSAGCIVQNTINNDAGDSVIIGCTFYGDSATTSYGVIQYSSGGLKITSNKFNNGTAAYYLLYTVTSNTSDLLINNNSIENMTGGAIVLTSTTGATHSFNNIVISGNQIAICVGGISTDASNFISELSIAGNTINVSSGSAVSLAQVTNFNISGNVFNGTGGTIGVSITTGTNGKIGSNTYSTATPVAVYTSPTVTVQMDAVQGTINTLSTGWAAYGSLYVSANTAITFPFTFKVAPAAGDIQVTAGSTNGAVTGYVVPGSITTSGCLLQAIGSINAIVATLTWKAWGIQ